MSELVYYDLKRAKKMTPSLSVQVARELGRRIVAGSFEAGALIEDENALAEAVDENAAPETTAADMSDAAAEAVAAAEAEAEDAEGDDE